MTIVGEAYYSGPLRVVDELDQPVTNLTNDDFQKEVYLNGVAKVIAVTVSHLSEGIYQARFLPNLPGSWTLIIKQATYNPAGWAEEVGVDILAYPTSPIEEGSTDAVLNAITANDFRLKFFRDFKYLPTYNENKVYFKDELVSLATYGAVNFYKMLLASAIGISPLETTDPPTWAVTNASQNDYILDADILNAFTQARAYTNPAIFESGTVLADAYYYCTAHFLVMDIRMAESGLDSRGEGLINSKSVGGVSVGMDIPESIGKDVQWSYFYQTDYGKKYLSYVIPRVSGIVDVAEGATTA